MMTPPSTPSEGMGEIVGRLRSQERERGRGGTFPEDLSTPSKRRQLSRGAYVLMQLAVVVLLIVGLVLLYHFFDTHF